MVIAYATDRLEGAIEKATNGWRRVTHYELQYPTLGPHGGCHWVIASVWLYSNERGGTTSWRAGVNMELCDTAATAGVVPKC